MRAKVGWGLVWGAILVSCFVGHSRRAHAGNCALYARAVTGVDLYGAAGGWWDEAAGRYQRGQAPSPGSILVFRRTRAIPSGHVAVVTKVVGPSMVLVDQSNWYHGRVTLGTPVVDTSPNHDWTTVAVMDLASGQFGRDNPTYGFVYPQSGPRELVAAVDTRGFSPYLAASRAAYDPEQQAGRFHFLVAEDDRYRHVRGRHAAHGKRARHSVRLAARSHGRPHAAGHSHSAGHAAARSGHAPAHRALARTAQAGPNHRS